MSVTRNEDGTVEFEHAKTRWQLISGGLLVMVQGRDTLVACEPASADYAYLLEYPEGRALLAEAISALDGCRICGKTPDIEYGVCKSHLIN